jgi:hypothetical protein
MHSCHSCLILAGKAGAYPSGGTFGGTFRTSLEEFVHMYYIVKRVSWFKSSLLLPIKTVDITNINS